MTPKNPTELRSYVIRQTELRSYVIRPTELLYKGRQKTRLHFIE